MNQKKEVYILIALTLISLFLFTWKIGSTPILDGDTAYSATIAKNIIKSGDWLTLKYTEDTGIIPKPPLFYWTIAAGFKIFGINEFGLSIFHSIFAVLTILLTYFIARELFDRRITLWSSVILLTSAQFFYQGRVPLQDIPLTLFITAALYMFILFEKRKNYLYYYLVPVFAALAVLVKGPVGLVLIGLVLLVYTIWNKKLLSYLNVHLLLAILVFLAVASPWFIAEYKILGDEFVDVFWRTNAGRFFMPTDQVGPDINAPIKPQFTFHELPLMLFFSLIPWSAFVYPAIFSYVKKEKFLIAWAFVVVLFFSLSLNYKIGRYILPALPALAILIAKFLSDALDNQDQHKKALTASKWIATLLIIPALLLAVVYYFRLFPTEQAIYQPMVIPSLIVLLSGMIISTGLLFRQQLKTAILGYLTTALITYIILIPLVSQYYPKAHPLKDFSQQISRFPAPYELFLFDASTSAPFIAFYQNKSFDECRSFDKLKNKLSSKKPVLVFSANPQIINDLKTFSSVNLKIHSQKSNFVLFSNQ